jgi:hypothetical protein
MSLSPSNRRAFLGTLRNALGAGGLLLPLAGNRALALPPNLGAAAQVSVKLEASPVSAEGQSLRSIRDALHKVHWAPQTERRTREWQHLMRDQYKPLADAITARPAPTWADCVELAEIVWQFLEKEDEPRRNDDWYYSVRGGKPAASGYSVRAAMDVCYSREAIVALVQAVLTLGQGRRCDPRTEQGYFPRHSAS